MKRIERKWMYERLDDSKKLRPDFAIGVKEFITHAKNQNDYLRNKQFRCPCTKCRNLVFLNEADVKKHLCLKSFCNNYYTWVYHGEEKGSEGTSVESENPYRDMIEDALRDNVNQLMEEALNADVVEESPNPQVSAFFKMLRRAEEPVCEWSKMSLMESAARLVNLKCEFNLPHKCVDRIASYFGDVMPQDHVMTRNFYETKNVLKALQLPHQRIDACPIGCMLFWKEDVDLDKCKKCGRGRFKVCVNANGKQVPKKELIYFPLSSRLQRLYATKHVAEEMRWYHENPRTRGIMSHPSDGEAWKHFDRQHPMFASEPRNVRLGLCTDGFAPFGQFGKSYSCWPVMITPYNLPPWLCLKKQFIFLSLIVPGPKNPKKNLDVCYGSCRMTGEDVFNHVRNLPTVVTGSDNDLKRLKSKRLGWWKKSIFWELPYWKDLLIRHNLDVMHIEKNFFEQLIHTVMDVKKKTSFTPNSLKNMKAVCRVRKNPNSFILSKESKTVLCEWISKLKFPDGYASDLSRCVDHKELRLHGLKSHDCHVFMERLLPVALRYLLPKNEWSAITELSQFFRDMCASTVNVENISRLQDNIAEIICKLEKIFPPSFFNSMEHLPIHLPYELKVGGPVHYRWMYPFERFLNHLRRTIGNKARIEGSICNTYLLEEISNFCSLYFENHIDTKVKNLDIGTEGKSCSTLPELFQNHMGKTTGKCLERFLDDKEYERAHIYVLSNCEILRPYETKFEEFIRVRHHELSGVDDILTKFEREFPKWLRNQVNEFQDPLLISLAMGPSKKVRTWKRYSINGFNFRSYKERTDLAKRSINNGVRVISTEGADFYGTLDEVMELSYVGKGCRYNIVLFKCDWFNNSEKGTTTHELYKLVEVNRTRKYGAYDPFVLAYQVDQVYYAPYPTLNKDKFQISAVFRTKARSQIDAPVDETVYQEDVNNDNPVLSAINVNEDEGENYDDVEILEEEVEGEQDKDEENEVENEEEEEEEDEEGGEEEEEDDGDYGKLFSDDKDHEISDDD